MRIVKVLTDKYWKGLLSEVEEKWLKQHHATQKDNTPEAAYFKYLQQKSEEGLDDSAFDSAILAALQGKQERKIRQFSWLNWRVAAAVVLFVVASISFKAGFMSVNQPAEQVIVADTYDDPEKALEETKKALLFISTQLNKGGMYATELAKFNETQEKLKKEEL